MVKIAKKMAVVAGSMLCGLSAAVTVASPAQALPGAITQIHQGGEHGKCLDGDGTKVQLWDCTGGQNQNWVYGAIPVFPGSIEIVNGHFSTCLDARNLTQGTAVQLQLCTQAPSQLWRPSTTG